MTARRVLLCVGLAALPMACDALLGIDGTISTRSDAAEAGEPDVVTSMLSGSESGDSEDGAATEASAATETGAESDDDGGDADDSLSADSSSDGMSPDAGGGQSDASETSEASDDAGLSDSGLHAPDACGSATEICNNGIDDNCNGLIDCSDPECTAGWTCNAAAVPAGWSIVAYAENARPSCPLGYGTSNDVFEGPNAAPAECACACNVSTHGSCETGTFSVEVSEMGQACVAPSITAPGNGGACSAAVEDFQPVQGGKMLVTPLGYSAGVCTAEPTTNLPTVSFASEGLVCTSTEGSGAGCANGGACVPATQGGGFAACISRAGVVACPAGFTSIHTVGAGIIDSRGCSACTCGAPSATCASPTLTFFTNAACSSGEQQVPANGNCSPFPGPSGLGAPTYVAYAYAASVQGEGCAPPPPVSPDGGVSLTTPRTVCCP